MESGKLDIDSEVKSPKEPVATYKPIPEDDSVLAARELAKEAVKMAKHDGDTDTEDGAQELMLKNTGKINSNKDASEVKFISENGDAKIDIETVKQTLTGMSKEELMKFANDPFWIRLRWFMFLTFWLLWLGMLAGAIAIIVMAPKCAAPEPKKTWEISPIVRLNPTAMNTTLKGLISTLDSLGKKHIKVISMVSIVQGLGEGHTTDFRNIQPELGTIKDFEELVKAAREREQEIVLELDPNQSSNNHTWFNQSVYRTDPYTNYYVWADNKTDDNGQMAPPYDWRSVSGGSAWEWNDIRKQYYLHQFDKTQPDLNYNNPDVVNEFSNILIHWMKLGVTGFRLAHTQYLLEDLVGGNKSPHHIGQSDEPRHDAYTRDLPDNVIRLQQWRDVVSNYTNNQGLFSLQEVIANDTLDLLNDKYTIDLPQKSRVLHTAHSDISASTLQLVVNSSSLPVVKKEEKPNPEKKSKVPWPAWDLNGPQRSLNERMDESVAESLTLTFLMLPGTPILGLSQTKYPGNAFELLTKAREQPAFLHGNTKTYVNNGTVFIYTRVKSGNPGYLIAYQSGEDAAILDLSQYDKVSDEVTIVALSSNYDQETIAVGDRISSKSVRISPKSTVVVQFAPKSE